MNLISLYKEIQPYRVTKEEDMPAAYRQVLMFLNKISISKIAMIFNGSSVVGLCRLNSSSKQSNMNLLHINIYRGSPRFGTGITKATYSPKSRLIVFMDSVIHSILRTADFSKIFPPTVKTVVIAMIYFIAFLALDYQLMKIDAFPIFKIGSGIPCFSAFICKPFMSACHACVRIINDCRFSISELYYNHVLIIQN